MHRFIFIKKNGKNIGVIVTYGGFRFLYAFLISLLAVEIDVVVGGKVMKPPAKTRIFFNTAGEKNCQHAYSRKTHQVSPEWHKGPVGCVALQLETKIGKTPPKLTRYKLFLRLLISYPC